MAVAELSQLSDLDDAELRAEAVRIAAERARIEARWLAVLAEISRRQLHATDGYKEPAPFLAALVGERRGHAKRDLELAAKVAASPVLAAALASGELSKAKVAELARAVGASDDEMGDLVEQAAGWHVDRVAIEVNRWLAERREQEPDPEPELSVTRRGQRVHVRATLDPEDGDWLETALDAAAARAGLPKDMPYAARRVAALTILCRFFLDHVDDVSDTRTGRPNLVVTVDYDTLLTGDGLARLGGGQYLHGDDARRLACDANVHRIITNGKSEVLDLGRMTKTPTVAQHRAVVFRDRHCTWPGCAAPPWACEVHHIHHWANGGRTDLDKLTLRCWHHHKHEHRTTARARTQRTAA